MVGEINNDGGGGAALRASFTRRRHVGTALELSNGRIKVERHQPARVPGGPEHLVRAPTTQYAVLDNPLINGDPNAMLVVTHTDTSTGGVLFAGMPLGVVFNTAANPIAGCTSDRWLVFTETNLTMPDIIVNVLAFST